MAANGSNVSQTLLMELDLEQFIEDDIPAVTLLTVLCVLGVFGNSHAIKVFETYPVSSITVLIKCVALVDLITSAISIPLEIVQLRYTLTYPSSMLCKLTRYIAYFCSSMTGLLLTAAANERYRRICTSRNSLSITKTKRLLIGFTSVSACISVYGVVYYDKLKKTTNGIEGEECDNSEDPLVNRVYIVTLTIITFVFCMICTILYVQIVNVIRKQIDHERAKCILIRNRVRDRNIPLQIMNIKDLTPQNPLQELKTRKQRYQNSRRMTIILLIGTCISFVGFLLHVLALIIKSIMGRNIQREFTSLYEFLLRCYFLHGAVNPVIFYIVDSRFRQCLRKIYSNLGNRLVTCVNRFRNGQQHSIGIVN